MPEESTGRIEQDIPTSPEDLQDGQRAQLLRRFDAPPEPRGVVTFETDELTAKCPFDFGGPDHYSVTLRYVPDHYCLESRSLKKYVETWRDEAVTAELLARVFYEDVQWAISPVRCYLRLEQARRGGIEEAVEVGDDGL